MTNKDLIRLFKLVASIMELHDENPFKVRSYSNVVYILERAEVPVKEISGTELEKMGISKGMVATIQEILSTGKFPTLQKLQETTPSGVIEMLDLPGIGPKKIRILWKELMIETSEGLLEAIKQGKIAKLKGFGEKTQDNIKTALLYKASNKGKVLISEAETYGYQLESLIKGEFPDAFVSFIGPLRRKCEVIESLELLISAEPERLEVIAEFLDQQELLEKNHKTSGPLSWRGVLEANKLPLEIKFSEKRDFHRKLFIYTGSRKHLSQPVSNGKSLLQILENQQVNSEAEIYELAGLPCIPVELREGLEEFELVKKGVPKLLEMSDLKGVIHAHSTWSDGKNTLEEMAKFCINAGYQYLGITDHSKATTTYANGLFEYQVKKQHEEIDELNVKLAPFCIFKGIESDILGDGSLDYEDDILASFDFIIASVHSGLSMDKERATERLLNAIKNPYTTILGHSSGRLLLRREGYPLDYKTIIDACAEHNVIIEINANPRRLDLDWRWVQYALEKNVMLSINPDAHSTSGIEHMYYGMLMGRKGGLTSEKTLNALSLEEVKRIFAEKRAKSTV